MPTHTRRAVLAFTGAATLAACGTKQRTDAAVAPSPGHYVSPHGPEVAATERKRFTNGDVYKARLTATVGPVELGGGRTVDTWTYNGDLPGPLIRLKAGDTFAARFANHLPETTSAHWHGINNRNDMDGVPGLTQPPIESGDDFDFRFAVSRPGTYWFHPHTGVQLDRGLYGPLIVDDPREPLSYDREWIVMLDDWVDGVGGSTAETVMGELMGKPAHPSRLLHKGHTPSLRGVPGHVKYPLYLVNGRASDDPSVFRAQPGDRIRIRIINAGSDTAFRVALGGHKMTVTHTDGSPVRHARTDCLLLGMAERYDVLVTAGDGVFPLTAVAEGKGASGLAILRTSSGERPTAAARPAELSRTLVLPARLRADDSVRLPGAAHPDRTLRFDLTGNMRRFNWAFNNQPYEPGRRHAIRAGERVRLTFRNHTHMWHPIHLHGHTFELTGGGPRKDTMVILPGQNISVDFKANNPGLWMLHCHNVYHSEAGMMTTLGYLR
jgi:FtsP/CotA-like multicopper oxidase with cupredoxin domain